MTAYILELAGFSFRMDLNFPVELSENFVSFLRPEDHPWQERLVIDCVDKLPQCPPPDQWNYEMGESQLDGKPCLLRKVTKPQEPLVLRVEETPDLWHYYFRRDPIDMPRNMLNLFNLIGLEDLLLRHDILILHSSLIRWKEKAILFSAPSGTGKSTQADLWAKYEHADILNGDRSALRKIHGTWTAFGLPLAGSSRIFRDESAPIRTLVLLEQGPENQITPLGPVQGLRQVFSEVTIHRWNRAFLEKALDLLMDLVQQVPIYRLSCLPDKGAVTLLRNTIEEVTP